MPEAEPLHQRRCIPCRGGVAPLTTVEQEPLLAQLRDWRVVQGHHLAKEWQFPDFATALAFLQRAAAICEEQGHHADFELAWGRVRASIWTHKVNGLTTSDFVLAAKFDRLPA